MLVSIDGDTLGDFTAAVERLPLRSVYFSLGNLRQDAAQLDLIIDEFQASKKDMGIYTTSFTASMLNSTFKLAENLGSCEGVPVRILQFYTKELEAFFGECPSDVLGNVYADLLALAADDFNGLSGERWAMNLLAPDKMEDHQARGEAERAAFIRHLVSQIERRKVKYREHKMPLWLFEGLRKSANRGAYGFLNFPSFFRASSQASGLLAWSSLGWLVVKLGERGALNGKLFGTGPEEWEFHEVAVKVMPRFINELTTLRSALDVQIRRAEGLESKCLALFLSASIASLQLLAQIVSKAVFHLDMD